MRPLDESDLLKPGKLARAVSETTPRAREGQSFHPTVDAMLTVSASEVVVLCRSCSHMRERREVVRRISTDPKSGASANFATLAC